MDVHLDEQSSINAVQYIDVDSLLVGLAEIALSQRLVDVPH